MGSIEIFTNQTHSIITLLALVVMFFVCIYTTKGQEKLFAPLWLFFLGVLLDIGANWVASAASSLYAYGKEINFYVFAELLLSLVAMLFMVLSAISFSLGGGTMLWLSMILGIIGFVAVGLFVFMFPDGEVVNAMRQIFPLAGIITAAIGFGGQIKGKYKSGFIVATIVLSIAALLLGMRFFGINIGSFWYNTAICYVLLSLAIIMIKVDLLSQKIDKDGYEIEKYNKKIEDIIRLSPFPILISKVGDDKILLANNNAIKLFGIDIDELERYKLKDFFADSDNRKLLSERLESEREVQDFEVLIKTPYSNMPFWLLASANIIDYNYEPVLYMAFQDITSRKNRENILQNQATKDPLTSIYNRRYFEEEVAKRITMAKKQKQEYSILMLDADYFKKVNDTYGHKLGDRVLIELASAAESALRDNDIVARYGGEEFVIYLASASASQGVAVAERLRQSIEKIVVLSEDNREVKFTVSIGVSTSEISDNIDVLIKTADEALYRAKQNGRNRVELFTPDNLAKFNKENLSMRKDESRNQHPVFDKENTEEISLLDGEQIINENLYSEDKNELL